MAVISGVGTRDSNMLDLEHNTSMGVVLVGRMHQQWELEVFEQRLTCYLPRLNVLRFVRSDIHQIMFIFDILFSLLSVQSRGSRRITAIFLQKCMYLVRKCSSIAIVTRAEVSFSDTPHSRSNVYFYLLDIISR